MIGHVYMALREDMMSDDTVISTMVNGYRSHKFGKISKQGAFMSEQRVVVMGLGNLLWADEGFGVRVAERLYAHYHWPEARDMSSMAVLRH